MKIGSFSPGFTAAIFLFLQEILVFTDFIFFTVDRFQVIFLCFSTQLI